MFTGWIDELHRVFGDLWIQEQMYLEHQDESVFIVRKDNSTMHFMLSDRKIVRVDHKMTDEQYHYAMSIWSAETKVVPFIIPQIEETSAEKVSEMPKGVVTVEMVRKMLQEQKQEIQEVMRSTQIDILREQREMNKQLMEGLVANLGKMLQASQTGDRVRLPSIENPSTAQITELQDSSSCVKDKERIKPKIESDVLIKASTNIETNEREEETIRRRRWVSQTSLMDAIPDMSTPKNRDKPHPSWVNIQPFGSPSPACSHYSGSEEGEIINHENVEDWDRKEGKRMRWAKQIPMVSKSKQSVYQIDNNNRDEVNETRKIDVGALIEKKVSETVDSFLKERSKIDENLNSIANLPERIKVEVCEKYSGTNRVYKLSANNKFEMFDDYLKSELRTKKLEYILNDEQTEGVSETKLTDDKHKVRDIIINHIDEKYYNKILDIKEPREVLSKLK